MSTTSFNTNLERLRRETEWDATEGIAEVYTVLKSLVTGGIDGPLIVNTRGTTPGITFRPADPLAGGAPFNVQTGGTNFNYTFGPQIGGASSFVVGPTTNQYGPTTIGGNSYNFYGTGTGGGTVVNNFNAGDFPPGSDGGPWGGGGGTGGGGGNGVTWPPLGETIPAGGDVAASAFGTVAAVGQIVSGSGDTYQMAVKGFGGGTFNTTATALGLSKDDKLDAGTWHSLTAYVTGPESADVFFTPAVFHKGRG